MAGGSRSLWVCPGRTCSVLSFLSLPLCFLAAKGGSSSAPLCSLVEKLFFTVTEAKKPVQHRLEQRARANFLLNRSSDIGNVVGVSWYLEWRTALTNSPRKKNTQKKTIKTPFDSGLGGVVIQCQSPCEHAIGLSFDAQHLNTHCVHMCLYIYI